jgi:hypothetical protein
MMHRGDLNVEDVGRRAVSVRQVAPIHELMTSGRGRDRAQRLRIACLCIGVLDRQHGRRSTRLFPRRRGFAGLVGLSTAGGIDLYGLFGPWRTRTEGHTQARTPRACILDFDFVLYDSFREPKGYAKAWHKHVSRR